MTENDPNNPLDQNPSENDDDLDNLSSDERAAFEKIMSQIEATDDDQDADTRDKSSESAPSSTDETVNEANPEEPADGSDSTEDDLTDQQQAALDNIMAEINGDDDANAETPATDPEPSLTGDDPDLTDDQQAALDKIMTEINGNEEGDDEQAPSEPEPAKATGDEDLTDDQQAALDKIMSEIKSDDDDAPAEAEPESSAPTDDEDLTDEQQAALDSIMADINGGDGDDSEAPAAESSPTSDKEELTDDQQAALDKIMSEINDSADDESVPQESDQPATDDDEELSDEQQAALDKIMADIGGSDDETGQTDEASPQNEDAAETLSEDQQDALDKIMAEIKGDEVDSPSDESTEQVVQDDDAALGVDPAPGESDSPKSDDQDSKEELTLDEFNEELNNLLGADPEAKTPGETSSPDDAVAAERTQDKKVEAPQDDGYAMLQEVNAGGEKTEKSVKEKKPRAGRRIKMKRRTLITSAVGLVLTVLVAGGAYWGYIKWSHGPETATAPATALVEQSSVVSEPIPGLPETVLQNDDSMPAAVETEIETTITSSPFALLKSDLEAARDHLQNKITEIKDLKSYYMTGIQEEHRNIESHVAKMSKPTFKAAVKNSKIKLSLQAIQRRTVYIAKLDGPLVRLAAMAETLLYMERRTRMLETLNSGISGLPVSELQHDVADTIRDQKEKSSQLSIDDMDVPMPSLASIWRDLRKNRTNISTGSQQREANLGLNRKIGEEVCKGDFDRKYLMTAMTAKTANCLSQWNGKDLYLNNLGELTPEAAKALAQWPGEWLSLNGVRSISAETAKYLSQWAGKRLSLNGLTALSSQATINLSQWRGEQLEMVGLTSIGRWENYGTRLYLSENLKRKLKTP